MANPWLCHALSVSLRFFSAYSIISINNSAQPHTPKPLEVCPCEENAHAVALGDEIVQEFDAHCLQLRMILSNTSLTTSSMPKAKRSGKFLHERFNMCILYIISCHLHLFKITIKIVNFHVQKICWNFWKYSSRWNKSTNRKDGRVPWSAQPCRPKKWSGPIPVDSVAPWQHPWPLLPKWLPWSRHSLHQGLQMPKIAEVINFPGGCKIIDHCDVSI